MINTFKAAVLTAVLTAVSCAVTVYPSGCVQIGRENVQPDWTYRPEIHDWRRNSDGVLMGFAFSQYSDLWLPTYVCAVTGGELRR